MRIILAPFLALALLTGCAQMDKTMDAAGRHPGAVVAAQGIVTYAVLKYAEDMEKASRVLNATDAAIALVRGDTPVTLAELEAAVVAEIDWSELPAEEATLVRTLIAAVRAELQARLGEKQLIDPENAVAVVTVLEWVKDAAALRLSGGTPA